MRICSYSRSNKMISVCVSQAFLPRGKTRFHFLPLCVTFKRSVSVFLHLLFLLLRLLRARRRSCWLSSALRRVITIYGRVSCLLVTSRLRLNVDNSHAPPPHPRRRSLVSFCWIRRRFLPEDKLCFFLCSLSQMDERKYFGCSQVFFRGGRLRDLFSVWCVIAAQTKRPLNDFSKMYEAGR